MLPNDYKARKGRIVKVRLYDSDYDNNVGQIVDWTALRHGNCLWEIAFSPADRAWCEEFWLVRPTLQEIKEFLGPVVRRFDDAEKGWGRGIVRTFCEEGNYMICAHWANDIGAAWSPVEAVKPGHPLEQLAGVADGDE